MRRFVDRVWLAGIFLVAWIAHGLVGQQAHALDFVHDIVPILKRNCVHCHGGREAEGDFSLNNRGTLLESGHIDLEDPGSSYLLELINSTDPDVQMPPPDRPRMTEQEVVLIRRWIDEGLNWDDDFTFAIQTYEPPLRPRTPRLPVALSGRDHPIDRILDNYSVKLSLPLTKPIDDAVFLRRTSLDLVGLLPTEEKLAEFLADKDPKKRTRLIDELLSDQIDYADHWLTFFNDLLRNDYSGTGFITKGRKQISGWLYKSLHDNKPFDVMARELIAPPTPDSQGYIDGIKWRGEVSAGQTLPIQFSQSISQSFLGINMKCASCHDSFIDRWKLTDAYGLAAIYANETLQLHRCDKPIGETAKASWLFPELGQVDPNAPRQQRLEQLAELMTHRDNGRFARTIANRLWYQLMGRGIVHPLDAMQSKPWNEDLLDYLAVDLVENKFDLKSTLRRIATSEAYQSQSERVGDSESGDDYVYRGPRARRMTAEQFLDSIWQLTGHAPKKFDAPVTRQEDLPEGEPADLSGQWIWGPLENGTVPGDQSVLLQKQFDLADTVEVANAIVTCDNGFKLYLNGTLVGQGDDWQTPEVIGLSEHLVPGQNTFIVVAKNGGKGPNPAGFYLHARFNSKNETQVVVESDGSWSFQSDASDNRENAIGGVPGQWNPVTLVDSLSVWRQAIDSTSHHLIAAMNGCDANSKLTVRASLLKNNALMKSLGRPMREQIVSMRPNTITTLEAIDLANESSLADSFAAGAKRLIASHNGRTDAIIATLFRSALARQPTAEESRLMKNLLGDDPKPSTVQDAMWAVCMLPEYMLIR